jgi:hypothetical protein
LQNPENVHRRAGGVAAVVSFALGVVTPEALGARARGLSFIALGLGLAFFPTAWNALSAA